MGPNISHPKSFIRLGETLLPWCIAAAVIFGCLGLLLGLVFSQSDYQQGEIVRIMYVHVPASWGALGVYTAMAILSGWGFVTRAPLCISLQNPLHLLGLLLPSSV